MQKIYESMKDIRIIEVTAENVSDYGVYCIKDNKSSGYKLTVYWFKSKINNGLKIQIAIDTQNKQLGFIEYMPSEFAWRPVRADNYYFVQCILLFDKSARKHGIGSALLQICEQDAGINNKFGVCAMSSDGPWMADKSLFRKNGFEIADKLDRFELMVKKFDNKNPSPHFNDWTKKQLQYKGWHLIYADQCPWHKRSVTDLKQTALNNGIKLKVKKLTNPEEAQNAPSGFGTFSLLKDGKLLADHYISSKRFENIIKQEP
jgi:GNAT superfamily N-acetyltransferase